MALEKLQRSHVVYLGIFVLRVNLLKSPSHWPSDIGGLLHTPIALMIVWFKVVCSWS